MTASKRGFVYLVGAGPGNAELITLKGKQAIERADVLVYDRLIATTLLDYAPQHCEHVFVGKAPHQHSYTQNAINELLVKKAYAGYTVVRLKGGDPFVFGRGGEEALALKEAQVSYEIIPGVSSATAAAAYAGIPVTHRGFASSFTVITGHEDPQKNGAHLNWQSIASLEGTLVFVMGMNNLALIVAQLLQHGKCASTPIALIENGTCCKQKTVVGTLDTIVALAAHEHISNPALVVVGSVVSLRSQLAWFEDKPLFGKRILVTRAQHQASRLSALLANMGAEVAELPLISFEPPTKPAELSAAVRNLDLYEWLVFTSTNGVNAFFDELQKQNLDVRQLAGIQLVAVGSATCASLKARGLANIIVPKDYCAEGILKELRGKLTLGSHVLLVRAEHARTLLPSGLVHMGAVVSEVAAYKTVATPLDAATLQQDITGGAYDGVTFTSSSTVHTFVAALKHAANVNAGFSEALSASDSSSRAPLALPASLALYSIGPITTATLREYGLEPTAQANRFNITGLVEAMVKHSQKEDYHGMLSHHSYAQAPQQFNAQSPARRKYAFD